MDRKDSKLNVLFFYCDIVLFTIVKTTELKCLLFIIYIHVFGWMECDISSCFMPTKEFASLNFSSYIIHCVV